MYMSVWMDTHIHSLETYVMNVCIHYVCLDPFHVSFEHKCVYTCIHDMCVYVTRTHALETQGMFTHIHSLETYVMNVCIHYVSLYSFSGEICDGCVYSLRVSLFITSISSRDICCGYVYFILWRHIIKMCVLCIHSMCLYSLYGMDTHIHSLETYVMNMCIHVLWICVFMCYECVYALHVSLSIPWTRDTHSFTRDICYECVYPLCVSLFIFWRDMWWMCVLITCVSIHSMYIL